MLKQQRTRQTTDKLDPQPQKSTQVHTDVEKQGVLGTWKVHNLLYTMYIHQVYTYLYTLDIHNLCVYILLAIISSDIYLIVREVTGLDNGQVIR